jgi:hypothetical protein
MSSNEQAFRWLGDKAEARRQAGKKLTTMSGGRCSSAVAAMIASFIAVGLTQLH